MQKSVNIRYTSSECHYAQANMLSYRTSYVMQATLFIKSMLWNDTLMFPSIFSSWDLSLNNKNANINAHWSYWWPLKEWSESLPWWKSKTI